MASAADITKQIKAANDIVDVISGYLPVQRAGKMFKCVCPFHDDHRPSLNINREWQNYKCWACGADGDIFTFVEKYEKVNFREARMILAKRANISLEEDSPENDRKGQLYSVMAWAQQLFQKEFIDGDNASDARKYIGERKMAGALIRQFGVGYHSNENGWLMKQAERDRVPLDDLIEVGLVKFDDEKGTYYERFRERIMFPIRDIQGRVIAFGGRILPTSYLAGRTGKYINSPDTPLFNKSEVIYGLDMARHSASKDGYLAVVEGYVDVMMAHHTGFQTAVATMGTSLTSQHVAQLCRYAPKVILVYDADAGGQTGVDRALELFVSQDVELAVVTLPDSLDPADLLSQPNGAEVFRNCLSKAKDALEFKLESLLKKGDTGIDGTRRMIDAVLGVMAAAPAVPSGAGQMKQELILNRLAHRLGVNQNLVWGRLKELQNERRRSERREAEREAQRELVHTETVSVATVVAKQPKASNKPDPLARQLLQVILAEPELAKAARERVPPDEIQHPDARRILDEIYFLVDRGETSDLDAIRVKLLDRPDLITIAMRLEQVGRTLTERPLWLDKVAKEFSDRRTRGEKQQMKGELASADEQRQLELLKALQSKKAS